MAVLAVTVQASAVSASERLEFVGSTPCDAGPRRFLKIPAAARCERISWQLALSSNEQPAAFRLQVTYGMQAQNEPGFERGGTRAEVSGTWTARTEVARRVAGIVYRLTADDGRSLAMRQIGDNLLHLLNDDGSFLVGNGGWSYTLSRPDAVPRPKAPPSLEPATERPSGMAGVFDGRTPCREIARQLAVPQNEDCTKLKWRLRLYTDPVTGAAGRYVMEGTLYRKAPRTGKWTVMKRTSNPNQVVYQLKTDDGSTFVSLFRADDNILMFLNAGGELLVGDAYFSYTLNRIAGR